VDNLLKALEDVLPERKVAAVTIKKDVLQI
jgi:hypothetical protein